MRNLGWPKHVLSNVLGQPEDAIKVRSVGDGIHH